MDKRITGYFGVALGDCSGDAFLAGLRKRGMLKQLAAGVVAGEYTIEGLAQKADLPCNKVAEILNHYLPTKPTAINKGAFEIGTKRPTNDGYTEIFVGVDYVGARQGWIREHRYVMQEAEGRPLMSHEVVHHRNGIKNDNSLENLELLCAESHHRCITCPHYVELKELKGKLGLE